MLRSNNSRENAVAAGASVPISPRMWNVMTRVKGRVFAWSGRDQATRFSPPYEW
jgi:hypothetical protein